MNRLFSFTKLNQRGVAALPTLLILGGVIMNIVIIITLGVYLLVNSGFGEKLSIEALSTAKAGVQDGILRVARNKNYNGAYNLSVGSRVVSVDVCKDTCSGVGKTKVSSVGTVLTRKRKLEAVLLISSIGEIHLESLDEVPL